MIAVEETDDTSDVEKRGGWIAASVVAIAVVVFLLWLYRDIASGMLFIWRESATYSHCPLVLLIAAWLFAQKRSELSKFTPQVWLAPIGLLVVAALVIEAARLLNIDVLMHLALWAALVATFLLVFGKAVGRVVRFALLYSVLAVPFGSSLVLPLMEFTADFVVVAVELVGIPVVRNGMYFSTSFGNFEVAEACSGIRYIFATLAFGLVVAHVMQTSRRKRCLFLVACVLVPLIGNALRAFGIVLIAHYSEMKHAVGIDHIVYGWVFYIAIVAALLLIARWLSDSAGEVHADSVESLASDPQADVMRGVGKSRLVTSAIVAVGLVFVVQQSFSALVGSAVEHQTELTKLFSSADETQSYNRPAFLNLTASSQSNDAIEFYKSIPEHNGSASIGIVFLKPQDAGNIHSEPKSWLSPGWNQSRSLLSAGETSVPANVVEAVVSRGDESYDIWYWYVAGGQRTDSYWQFRTRSLRAQITGSKEAVALVVIAVRATYQNDTQFVLNDIVNRYASAMPCIFESGKPCYGTDILSVTGQASPSSEGI